MHADVVAGLIGRAHRLARSSSRLFFALAAAAIALMAIACVVPFVAPRSYDVFTTHYRAQGVGQDVATLVVVVPAMIAALRAARGGSTRGEIVLLGGLAYALYSYVVYAFSGFTPLFPLHVAIFSLAAFALAIRLRALDVDAFAERFRPGRLLSAVAIYDIAVAALFALLYTSQILPAIARGAMPDELARSGGVTAVYAIDLGVFLPLLALSGVLLLRRRPLGVLLTAILIVKQVALGFAILAMLAAMARQGQPVAPFQVGLFTVLAIAASFAAGAFVVSAREATPEERPLLRGSP
jgi:hypothetical protein